MVEAMGIKTYKANGNDIKKCYETFLKFYQ